MKKRISQIMNKYILVVIYIIALIGFITLGMPVKVFYFIQGFHMFCLSVVFLMVFFMCWAYRQYLHKMKGLASLRLGPEYIKDDIETFNKEIEKLDLLETSLSFSSRLKREWFEIIFTHMVLSSVAFAFYYFNESLALYIQLGLISSCLIFQLLIVAMLKKSLSKSLKGMKKVVAGMREKLENETRKEQAIFKQFMMI